MDQLVFYKRKRPLHVDTNSNSAHEGTNRGMDSPAVPTKPQHALEKAAKVLSHQAHLKALLLETGIACKVNGTTLGGISLVKIVWLSWQSVGSITRVDDSEGPYVDSGRQDIF